MSEGNCDLCDHPDDDCNCWCDCGDQKPPHRAECWTCTPFEDLWDGCPICDGDSCPECDDS